MDISRRGLLFAGVGAAASSFPWFAKAQAPAQLSYWGTFSTPRELKGYERVVKLFQQRNPRISVVPESVPSGPYMAKLTTAVMANSPPGAAQLFSERLIDALSFGGVTDLSKPMKSWPMLGEYRPEDIEQASYGGKLYAVPAFQYIDWVYYRKDWLEEAGLEPPKTFDEFITVAVKMTDPAKGRFGFGMRGGASGHREVVDVLEAFGSPIVEKGQPAIKRDVAIDALTFYTELYTKLKVCPPSAPSDGYRPMMDAFKAGRTAMIWHQTGSLTEVQASLTEKQFGTTVRPRGPARHINRVSPVLNVVCDPARSEAGWSWLAFWAEPEASIAFFEETGFLPSTKSALQDPRVANNPLFGPAIEAMSFGKSPERFTGQTGWLEQVVLPEFQRVLVGQTKPAAAIDAMIAGLEKALN